MCVAFHTITIRMMKGRTGFFALFRPNGQAVSLSSHLFCYRSCFLLLVTCIPFITRLVARNIGHPLNESALVNYVNKEEVFMCDLVEVIHSIQIVQFFHGILCRLSLGLSQTICFPLYPRLLHSLDKSWIQLHMKPLFPRSITRKSTG
jgi:hypothetical protein